MPVGEMELALTTNPETTVTATTAAAGAADGEMPSSRSTTGRVPVTMLKTPRAPWPHSLHGSPVSCPLWRGSPRRRAVRRWAGQTRPARLLRSFAIYVLNITSRD